MKHRELLAAVVLAAVFAAPVQAQETLGALIDKGAKKITKDEWIAMLPITSSSVWLDGQGEAQLTYKADGSLSGNARHYPSGTSSGAYGTWTIDESGKICIDERFTSWPNPHRECTIRFRLGDEFFRVATDADRNAKAVRHTLKK